MLEFIELFFKNNMQKKSKTLGVRRNPGEFLLNRYANPSRQTGPSATVGYSHNPLKFNDYGRKYHPGEDPLITYGEVDDTTFASLDNQYINSEHHSFESTTKILYKYKDLCIKQAKSAHHEQGIDVHLRNGTIPTGIFTPLLSTLTKSICSPFDNSETFRNGLTEITEKCANDILQLLKSHWSERKSDLRDETNAMYSHLQNKLETCNNLEKTVLNQKMAGIAHNIMEEKQTLAKRRKIKYYKRTAELNLDTSPPPKKMTLELPVNYTQNEPANNTSVHDNFISTQNTGTSCQYNAPIGNTPYRNPVQITRLIKTDAKTAESTSGPYDGDQ